MLGMTRGLRRAGLSNAGKLLAHFQCNAEDAIRLVKSKVRIEWRGWWDKWWGLMVYKRSERRRNFLFRGRKPGQFSTRRYSCLGLKVILNFAQLSCSCLAKVFNEPIYRYGSGIGSVLVSPSHFQMVYLPETFMNLLSRPLSVVFGFCFPCPSAHQPPWLAH